MPKIELDLHSTAKPERILAALTDFSERRPDVWPGLSRELFKVYELGDTWAVVQEGNLKPMKVWAKERYDWSQPGLVTWTVLDSSFAKPGMGVSARVTGASDGGSDIHITWEREGKTVLHKLMIKMIVAMKGKPVAASFKLALDKLEKTSS